MLFCGIAKLSAKKIVTTKPRYLSSIHERGALIALKNKKQQTKQ
jgi:hypothetical protein